MSDVNAAVERLRLDIANTHMTDLRVHVQIGALEDVLKVLADRTSSLIDAEEDFDRMEIRAQTAEALLDRIQYALDNYSELVAHRYIGEIMNERKAA